MKLRFPDEDTITIPIDNGSLCTSYDLCESKVCNNVIQAVDCGDEVSGWLSYHLNTIGLRLVRQAKEDMRQLKMSRKHMSDEEETSGKLSLANQAQFLLVNNESIRWLQQLIGQDNDIDVVSCQHSQYYLRINKYNVCKTPSCLQDTFSDRFRGNFYIDGGTEFAENSWKWVTVGRVHFRVM